MPFDGDPRSVTTDLGPDPSRPGLAGRTGSDRARLGWAGDRLRPLVGRPGAAASTAPTGCCCSGAATRPGPATATGSPPAAAWTPGESSVAGAARELAEETGLRRRRRTELGEPVWHEVDRVPLRRPAVPPGAGVLPGPGAAEWRGRHGRVRRRSSATPSTSTGGGRPPSWSAPTDRFYPAELPALLRRLSGGERLVLTPPRTVVRREGGLYALERALQRRGFRHVAGADEAGRGACAGPLVAAAAVLPEGKRGEIDELADSKLLTPARPGTGLRRGGATGRWPTSVVIIPPAEVDARGLHVCNLAAMRRALASLATRPEYVLTDGFPRGRPGRARARGLEGRPGRGLRRGGQRAGQGHPGPDHGRAGRPVSRTTGSPSTRATSPTEHSAALEPARAVRGASLLVRERGRRLRSRPAARRGPGGRSRSARTSR